MSGKSRVPSRAPGQSAVGPEQAAPEQAVSSNAQAVTMLPMPPELPSLGHEILDLLSDSLGESEVGVGSAGESGSGIAADPTSPPAWGGVPDPGTCGPPGALNAKDRQILHQLARLLTYSNNMDRVTFEEVLTAQGLLGQLSPCGHEQFIALGDGALVDRLLANPEGEGWWANPLGNLAERPEGLVDAAYSWWRGDEALEVAQAGMGGSIDGVTLDTSKDNGVDVVTHLRSGTIQATIPNLSIKSIRHAAQGATVRSGPGTVLHSVVTLNLPDRESSTLSGDVSIDSIDWSGLDVETSTSTALIQSLVVSSVALSAIQATLDPQTVATATAAPALARAAMTSQLTRILLPQFNLFATLMAPLALAATRPAQDAEVALREALELGSVDALDASIEIGSIALPGGVQVTGTTADGTNASISSLSIDGITLSLQQVDRIQALRMQAAQLALSPDVLDQERLASIQTQLAELEDKAIERAALEQQAQRGTLTQAETDTLTLLKRDLSAGMLRLKIRSVTATGIQQDGVVAQDINGRGISLVAVGDALGVRFQDQQTQQEAVDERQEIKDTRHTSYDAYLANNGIRALPKADEAEETSSRPAWALPEFLEDLNFDGSAQQLTADGVKTAHGDAGHAGASNISIRGNGSVIGIEAHNLESDGLDAYGLTAGPLDADRADVRLRGNSIGGIVEGVAGDDIHYAGTGMTADMATGQADTVRFDADIETQTLHTGSIDSGRATGLDYQDAGQRVVAANASAQTIQARGATANGVESLTVASGQAADGSYRRHAAPERIGADGQTIEAVKGVDAAFDTAQIADLRVTDATTAATGTVDLASLDAQGVTGGMDETGTASADVVSVRALHASRDTDGAMNASIDELTASGAIGQLPGTGTASADEIAIHGITGTGDAAGNYGAKAETGRMEGVQVLAPGRAEGTVDSVDLTGLHGGMSADGSMGAGTDVLTANGLEGQVAGHGEGSLQSATFYDAEGHLNAGGTGGVRTSGGEFAAIDGVYGERVDPTATGQVDRVGFGFAGADFDEEYNVTGAEVNDLEAAGISVELLKLPLDEVAEVAEETPGAEDAVSSNSAATAGAVAGPVVGAAADVAVGATVDSQSEQAPEAFHADALAGMSGTIELAIPVKPSGSLIVHGTAQDGMVSVKELRVRYVGKLPIPAAAVSATIQVDEGRGLVVGFGPVNLYCAIDSRKYDGLISRREGGGRRGSVNVSALLEGIMNAEVENTDEGNESVTPDSHLRQRRHSRRNNRDRRKAGRKGESDDATSSDSQDSAPSSVQSSIDSAVADRGRRLFGIDFAVVPSQTRIISASVDLGAGMLGYDSMSVNITDTFHDAFRIEGSLAESVQAQTAYWGADDAQFKLESGKEISAESVGISGVELSIHHPLSTDRQVMISVAEGSIHRIVFGEGTRDQE